jgi:hypothetical protein
MGSRLLRSVAAGSSLVLGRDLLLVRGDIRRLAHNVDRAARYQYDLEGGDGNYPSPITPREAFLIEAAAGAAAGAGYFLFSRLVPGRGPLRGAAYGATFWMFMELLFQTAPNRDQGRFVSARVYLGGLVTSGALLGWLVDR